MIDTTWAADTSADSGQLEIGEGLLDGRARLPDALRVQCPSRPGTGE